MAAKQHHQRKHGVKQHGGGAVSVAAWRNARSGDENMAHHLAYVSASLRCEKRQRESKHGSIGNISGSVARQRAAYGGAAASEISAWRRHQSAHQQQASKRSMSAIPCNEENMSIIIMVSVSRVSVARSARMA